MLKLLGTLCVMMGALWYGSGAVGELRRRALALEELHSGLVWLEEELTFRMAPLPGLLEQLGQSRRGETGLFFKEVTQLLTKDPESGLYPCWRQAMVRQLSLLHPEERQVLLELGQTLGRYDAQTQRQALAQGARRLAALRDKAGEEVRRLGKVYAALSLAGGAAVILVLV